MECQPQAGLEIAIYTLWLEYTRGQFTFLLTPNPCCGDVECQPQAGLEIVVYTLWLEYTRGQFTFLLTPNPRCGDVECQPQAGLEIVTLYTVARVHKGAVHFSPNA